MTHRYELHRSNTHDIDEIGRRYRWCIYDYFTDNDHSGLSFWYFATKRDAMLKYGDVLAFDDPELEDEL
jgi:hypothetical protein